MQFIDELFAASGYTTNTIGVTGIGNGLLQTAAKNYILSNLEEISEKLRNRLRTIRADSPELDLARCIVQTAYVKSVQHDALLEFYLLALGNTNKLPNTHSHVYVEKMMKFFSSSGTEDFSKYMEVAYAANSSIRPEKEYTKYILKKLMVSKGVISKELAENFLMEVKDIDITNEATYNVTFRMVDYLHQFTPKAAIIYERKFNEFWSHRNKPKLNMWGTGCNHSSFKNGVSERAAIMKSVFTCTDTDLRYKIARNFLLKKDEVLKKRLLKMVPEFQKLLNLK